MSPERRLPEFWYPVAQILLVLRALLRAAQPGGYGAIAAGIHRELAWAGAFVRRYLLALARGLVLHPLRLRCRPLDKPLTLSEPPAPKRAPGRHRGAPSPEQVEWALALQRTETLLAALRRPLPIARRLARRLTRGAAPVLRALAVPWHVIRGLPPARDILLTRLDVLARPDHWSGLDPDTG